MTRIGEISLDLVIASHIAAQLDKIRAEVQRPASLLGEKISETVSNAADKLDIEVPMPEIPQIEFPEPDTSAVEQSFEEINALAKRALERNNSVSFDAETPKIDVPEAVNTKVYVEYDSAQVEAEMTELEKKLSEPVDKLNREIREKLGTYDIPDEPVAALRQEINNTYFKLELLQKKWQELSAAEPTDKVCSQLQSVQSQIISATKSIEKLESKLADAAKPVDISLPIDTNAVKAKMDETEKAVTSKLNNINKSASSAGKAVVKNLGGGLKSVEKTGQKSLNKLNTGFKKLSNPITKLGKTIKSAFKSVFIAAGLYAMFRAIKDGFAEAAKADEKFISSLNAVKANLSVAFMPIIQSVMPILNTLMAGLAAATKSAASFISGLFGKTYQQSAEAVKKLKSISDTAKKAKQSMAGIDEMNILSSSDDVEKKDSGLDNLGEGDIGAEKLGSKVRETLLAAFEAVKEKGKSVFQNIGEWASNSFSPTFTGIWNGLKTEAEELKEKLNKVFTDIQSLGDDLKNYFSGDFTEHIRTSFEVVGMIAVGLLDTFNQVFSDIWNVVVYPILQNFITKGLPTIAEFSTQAVITLGTLFTEVKKSFDELWNEAAKPILTLVSKIWQDVMSSLKEFWDKWGEPIFTKLREAIKNTGENFRSAWNNFLKPIFDKLMKTANKLWDEHLKPLVDNFLDLVGTFIDGGLEIYNKFIAPIVKWFTEKLGPPIAKEIGFLIEISGKFVGTILDAVNHIIDYLKGIVNFVVGIFTGDWERAWGGIKESFAGIWNAMVDVVRAPINLIIDLVNGMNNSIENGINYMIDGINNLSFEIPDWVPGVGGKSFGLDLSYIDIPDIPNIPQLANGGLATEPTLAMVGDNRNARTDPEVIAPLSKLKDMTGGDLREVVELLRIIIEMMKNGMNIEIINYLFKGSNELSREILKIVRADKARRGE